MHVQYTQRNIRPLTSNVKELTVCRCCFWGSGFVMLSRRYSARRVAMAVLLVGPTDDGLLGSRGTARERWPCGRSLNNHGPLSHYHG